MQIVPMKDKKQFAMAGLSFADLKTIRDACALFGKQGSTTAKELHEKIVGLMDNLTV
ncbi:MAG: hypothetical protein OEZ36_01620 [Spirochaetota bacterium]|nr:hypothetical protein [Spirochaetota bacterium]